MTQGAGGNRSIDLVASVTGVTGGEIPTGTVVFYDGDTAISEDIVIADGKAAFTWTQIPVGEHSLKAVYSGSANYQTAEGTASYNLDKDVQTELTITGPDTVIYGDEPFTLTVSGGSGTGAISYAVAGESVVYDETNGTFTVVKTGESTITITKAADEDYNEATAVLTITVSPAAPVLAEGAEVTAERVRRGNSLSTSEITGTVNGLDGQPLEGAWTWKNDREMDEAGTFEETAVFTPTDTNYAPFETTVSVTVYRPSSGGGSLTTRYTVTFDTQGGSEIDSIRVTRNGTVTKPEKPTKDGYIFEGWFTDKDCTQAYDFSTRVTKNITLYAKWTEEQIEDPDNPTDPDEPDNPDEPAPPSEWENPYSDVAESDWFYDAVKYADENGLFAGTAETTFAPEESLTRAMLVTVLWRAEGQPVTNYLMTFADVDEGAYYGEAVRWAASEGIVKGYSEVEFAPDDLITREQIAAIMQRYADFKGIAADETADLARFTDAAQVSDWAVGNMQWAVGTGLISGRGDGSLAPQDNTTRAEAAAILMRFLEK